MDFQDREKLNPDILLLQGQTVQLSPQGTSMCPLLYPNRGDQVILVPLQGNQEADGRKVRVGDVVLFRRWKNETQMGGQNDNTPNSTPNSTSNSTNNSTSNSTSNNNNDTNTKQDDILVLHRVMKITEQGYFFAGDNQRKLEGPILAQQLRGRMVARVRKGKEISMDHPWIRLVYGFWRILFPVRGFFHEIRHRLPY